MENEIFCMKQKRVVLTGNRTMDLLNIEFIFALKFA